MPDLHAQPLVESMLLLLLAARVGGELMERLRQPAMIGEILAGVCLGPSLLGWVGMSPQLGPISELAVLLLMLLAGMELDPSDLRDSVKGRGGWVAIMSFFLPLAAGILAGAALRLDVYRTFFLGLCVAITALPVSVRILMDLGRLQSDVGRRILSAAIFNDVAALLVLGVVLQASSAQSSWLAVAATLGWTSLKVCLFMAFVVAAYRALQFTTRLLPETRKAIRRVLEDLKGKETLFALTLLFVMVFATLSEAVGLHFVVGTFFGAMILSREVLGEENFERVRSTTSTVSMGFLAPVFFATIGLEFDVASFKRWELVLGVLAVSFLSKILGGYWGGRLAGLPRQESWALGFGLNGRGIMELVIAKIALAKGFIGPQLFSTLVLMGLVTTLVTPVLLKRSFERIDGRAA